MPNRKLVVTHKQPFGSGADESVLVRMVDVRDAEDTEAVALNVGIRSMAVIVRLDPATDLSAWVVGDTKILDVGL